MRVTFQYFDDCPKWRTTHQRLTEVLARHPEAELEMTRVETPEEAESVGFRGSPSVLVDGVDPFDNNPVPAGTLACRVYPTADGSPTVEQLEAALAESER